MRWIVQLLLVTFGACGGTKTSPPAEPVTDAAPAPSIGSATMRADGTIALQLRAEGPGGAIGDALLTYAPDDERYREVLDHLGGLEPGQTKPVPPWPTRLAISKGGERLGVLEIKAGEMGTLTLEGSSDRARELEATWNKAAAKGSVGLHMHMPTRDGSRGPYGVKLYRPDSTDWVDGVTNWLRYEKSYKVAPL